MRHAASLLSLYDNKELVYVPWGADKGDCPYCDKGVLRRDEKTEEIFRVSEGYVCDLCRTRFTELARRYFYRNHLQSK